MIQSAIIGGLKILDQKNKTPQAKKIFRDKNHNVMFTDKKFQIYKKIAELFADNMTKRRHGRKIAAIVPAYNEKEYLGEILKVLEQTKIVDEIIVVDDASTDNTAQVAATFPKVKLLRNSVNKGKAYAMQRGVDATDVDILFFCDADLKKLTPDIVKQIIQPVADKKYDMFIGIRNNLMQKTFHCLPSIPANAPLNGSYGTSCRNVLNTVTALKPALILSPNIRAGATAGKNLTITKPSKKKNTAGLKARFCAGG